MSAYIRQSQDGKSSVSACGKSYHARSQNLSQVSKTSNKSVKSINASLERTHTFGMSSIHKTKYDIEKSSTQNEIQKNITELNSKKKIQKTTSLAKLKDGMITSPSGTSQNKNE